MSIEAMKQMVSSLERIDLWLKARYSGIGLVGDEIAALEAGRQAIAEAEQEPVAWELGAEVYWNDSPELSDYIRKEGTPLYTHPQPKAAVPTEHKQEPFAWCIESENSADWCFAKTKEGVELNAVLMDEDCIKTAPFPIYTNPQPKAEQFDHQKAAQNGLREAMNRSQEVARATQPKAEKQEPVAWRWGVPKLKNGTFEWRYSLNKTREDAIPLYTKEQL